MVTTIVITGVDGFVGRHVAAIAHERGLRVLGVTRNPLGDDPIQDYLVDAVATDLTTGWPDISGDAILHLAGYAAVGPSFERPQQYLDGNSAMVTHLCEAVLRSAAPRPRLLGVSSGAVYAGASAEPLDEASPTRPSSPYAVSKLLVELQLKYYESRGLDVVIVRPFNHIGPGQATGFLVPDLVAALRQLDAGEPLCVGDLSTARDYTDVRDVARAYLDLITAPTHRHSLYNVASGISMTGHEVLGLAAAALDMPVPATKIDASRVRSGDQSRIVGDAARLKIETGWNPKIAVGKSIRDYVAAD